MTNKRISKEQHKSSILRQRVEPIVEEDQTQVAASALKNSETHQMTPDTILSLQSTIGNAAVQRLLSNTSASSSDSTSISQSSSSSSIQRNLSKFLNLFKKKKPINVQRTLKSNGVKATDTGEVAGGNSVYYVHRTARPELFRKKDKVFGFSGKKDIVFVFGKNGKGKHAINLKDFSIDSEISSWIEGKKLDKLKHKLDAKYGS